MFLCLDFLLLTFIFKKGVFRWGSHDSKSHCQQYHQQEPLCIHGLIWKAKLKPLCCQSDERMGTMYLPMERPKYSIIVAELINFTGSQELQAN